MWQLQVFILTLEIKKNNCAISNKFHNAQLGQKVCICIGNKFGYWWYCPFVQINGGILYILFNYYGEDIKIPDIQEKFQLIRLWWQIYLIHQKYIVSCIWNQKLIYKRESNLSDKNVMSVSRNGKFCHIFFKYCCMNTTTYELLWLGLATVWWYKWRIR